MQLTFIVPNITSNSNLKNVLSTMSGQDNQDFELILITTNTSASMYKTFEKYLKFFGSRLKLITNSKRRSIQNDIVSGFHLAEGKFVHIYFPDNPGRPYFANRLIENAQTYDVDILEFRPRLINSIRWKPEPRLEENKVYNMEKNPECIPYIYPFIFNKVFKKTLVEKFIKFKSKELNDTKFAVLLTYMLILKAEDYVYVNERIVRENIASDLWLTPSNFIYEFEELSKYLKLNEIKLTQEIDYATFYFLQVFLGGILHTWRKRISLKIFKDHSNYKERRAKKFTKDLHKYLTKCHSENRLFFDTNIYMLKDNIEADSIRFLPELNKWDTVLGEL